MKFVDDDDDDACIMVTFSDTCVVYYIVRLCELWTDDCHVNYANLRQHKWPVLRLGVRTPFLAGCRRRRLNRAQL